MVEVKDLHLAQVYFDERKLVGYRTDLGYQTKKFFPWLQADTTKSGLIKLVEGRKEVPPRRDRLGGKDVGRKYAESLLSFLKRIVLSRREILLLQSFQLLEEGSKILQGVSPFPNSELIVPQIFEKVKRFLLPFLLELYLERKKGTLQFLDFLAKIRDAITCLVCGFLL